MSNKNKLQEKNTQLRNKLKNYTSARVAIGRAGGSLTTSELLKFQCEHAQARDAVHLPLDLVALKKDIYSVFDKKWLSLLEHSMNVKSQADNRETYLQRPDLGRSLNQASVDKLTPVKNKFDLLICIVDGLSSLAIANNVPDFLKTLLIELESDKFEIAPLVFVEHGRVAIGDQIAELMGAKTVLVLIGERPGLLSPDSLGVYLTYQPKVGVHDAMRNCISNIRKGGLSYAEAASKVLYLIKESSRLGFSGVDLKERANTQELNSEPDKHFLF